MAPSEERAMPDRAEAIDDGYARLHWLTPSAAALRKGIKVSHVRAAADAGLIRCYRLAKSGHRRIDPESLDAYIPYVRVSDAAQRLGCSVDTIRRMLEDGELQGRRNSTGHRFIDPDSIRRAERNRP